MNEPGEAGERRNVVDPLLWHACAGRLVHVPPVNANVFYFPQGHVEHAGANADYTAAYRVPPNIHCRVTAVEFNVELDSDEVFTRISLVPLPIEAYIEAINRDCVDDVLGGIVNLERPQFFSKVLTQSDAHNGGGFSVPKKLAETIFPALDYNDDPPVQTLRARDVQGRIWRFRHVYRGRPLRHLLTTGWSKFVNAKKLVAGDSIVFSKADNGEVSVGIRRVKRESRVGRKRAESAIEAVNNGTTEFCVEATAVYAAVMRKSQLGPGARFKMAFESEDSSRVSWFMGSINSDVDDQPSRWLDSLWRLLQVTWDGGDIKFVRCINPWLVRVVSTHTIQNKDRDRDGGRGRGRGRDRDGTHAAKQLEKSTNTENNNNQILHLFGVRIDTGQKSCL
ncbi:auxin response factor 16-like [Humulus lupulus]|uniref:auxin response factor 16-like n=1 Tax=Humulus lupulus TaxID=3486 RepID=UPI002B40ACCF|nr:auxin response factor 16-like [Humulus lupulus]XP_062074816.1 auxin response factor 16-like [Humulus lupulus]